MQRQSDRVKQQNRDIIISIRVNEIEYQRLIEESKARGDTPMACFIREAISPILTGETAKQREAV